MAHWYSSARRSRVGRCGGYPESPGQFSQYEKFLNVFLSSGQCLFHSSAAVCCVQPCATRIAASGPLLDSTLSCAAICAQAMPLALSSPTSDNVAVSMILLVTDGDNQAAMSEPLSETRPRLTAYVAAQPTTSVPNDKVVLAEHDDGYAPQHRQSGCRRRLGWRLTNERFKAFAALVPAAGGATLHASTAPAILGASGRYRRTRILVSTCTGHTGNGIGTCR